MPYSFSLHSRIFISAMLLLSLFLGVSGFVLHRFYQSSAEQFLQDQLQNTIYALLAAAKETPEGKMRLPKQLPNPKLNQPDSGIVAHIIGEDGQYEWFSSSYLNSNNAFKQAISLQKKTSIGEYIYLITPQNLSLLSFTIAWEDYAGKELQYTIKVISERHSVEQQVSHFQKQLWTWLGSSGLCLVLLQMLVLNWSLRPLRKATNEVLAIQQGDIPHLSSSYPRELALLTENINRLVIHSTAQLKRYRNGLGDLSHSLKTPLAIIDGEIDKPITTEKTEQILAQFKQVIKEQVSQINLHVQYHLQRASISSSHPVMGKTAISPIIDQLVRSLNKVYFDKPINCQINCQPERYFLGEKGDLMELLGNILDNAFKYGEKNIFVHCDKLQQKEQLVIQVIDDGNGISEQYIQQVVQRGVRVDQQQTGHGLGLHIASEIIQQYQGEIELSNQVGNNKQIVGLSVTIHLPGF